MIEWNKSDFEKITTTLNNHIDLSIRNYIKSFLFKNKIDKQFVLQISFNLTDKFTIRVDNNELIITIINDEFNYKVNNFHFKDSDKLNTIFWILLNHIFNTNQFEFFLKTLFSEIKNIYFDYFLNNSHNVFENYIKIYKENIINCNNGLNSVWNNFVRNENTHYYFSKPKIEITKNIREYSYQQYRYGKDNKEISVTTTFYKLKLNYDLLNEKEKLTNIDLALKYEKELELLKETTTSSINYFGTSNNNIFDEQEIELGVDIEITRKLIHNETQISQLTKDDINLLIFFMFFDLNELLDELLEEYGNNITTIFYNIYKRYFDFMHISNNHFIRSSKGRLSPTSKKRSYEKMRSHFKINPFYFESILKIKAENAIYSKTNKTNYDMLINNFLINHPTNIHSIEIIYLLHEVFKKEFFVRFNNQ